MHAAVRPTVTAACGIRVFRFIHGEIEMSEFTDKVVIIVGASGKDNTGQCMARRFAAEGAHVLVSGRRAEPLDELAREIGCA